MSVMSSGRTPEEIEKRLLEIWVTVKTHENNCMCDGCAELYRLTDEWMGAAPEEGMETD